MATTQLTGKKTSEILATPQLTSKTPENLEAPQLTYKNSRKYHNIPSSAVKHEKLSQPRPLTSRAANITRAVVFITAVVWRRSVQVAALTQPFIRQVHLAREQHYQPNDWSFQHII